MKVLLVSSPFYRLMGSHYNGINLGLGYLSAVLENVGVECKMYNADFQNNENYADQRRLYNNYEDFKEIMQDSRHPIWQECIDRILAYDPQLVGFSMFTANCPAVDILSHRIKEIAPHIKTVAGGPHVSLARDIVLRECDALDFAIQGEGETSFLQLIQGRPLHEIKGLIFRHNGCVVVNPGPPFIRDIDNLPFPMRDNCYPKGLKVESHYIITSRGCPNNCSFCASPVIWKRRVRFRSVENIVEELRLMKESGYTYIQFLDDTFTFGKKRLLHLLSMMEALDFQWTCDTRLTCLDTEILRAMKDAGCIRVKVGIESGNKAILKKTNKGLTPELVIEKTGLIKKAGLSLTVYFMIGFPGETDIEARETIGLAKRIEADYYSLSTLAPYYGTEIYQDFIHSERHEEMKDHWEYFFHQSRDMILTTGISEKVIEDFWALNELGKGKRI